MSLLSVLSLGSADEGDGSYVRLVALEMHIVFTCIHL